MADYSAMSDRELDAAVAERVFGWRWIHEDGEQPYAVPYLVGPGSSVYYPTVHAKFPNVPKSGGDLLNYSTDIAAAWEVVERVKSTKVRFLMFYDAEWCVAEFFAIEAGERIGEASLPPKQIARAICLAALAAVEAKENTNA